MGVVAARDSASGRRLPVWVTGHSLGGGYANALALHLLANRATAQLFGAGLLLCRTPSHTLRLPAEDCHCSTLLYHLEDGFPY